MCHKSLISCLAFFLCLDPFVIRTDLYPTGNMSAVKSLTGTPEANLGECITYLSASLVGFQIQWKCRKKSETGTSVDPLKLKGHACIRQKDLQKKIFKLCLPVY